MIGWLSPGVKPVRRLNSGFTSMSNGAVGGDLRPHVERDAGFLERGGADLAALLRLRQLLVGDFRHALKHRLFVFEHGHVRVGQQPGVVGTLQARATTAVMSRCWLRFMNVSVLPAAAGGKRHLRDRIDAERSFADRRRRRCRALTAWFQLMPSCSMSCRLMS